MRLRDALFRSTLPYSVLSGSGLDCPEWLCYAGYGRFLRYGSVGIAMDVLRGHGYACGDVAAGRSIPYYPALFSIDADCRVYAVYGCGWNGMLWQRNCVIAPKIALHSGLFLLIPYDTGRGSASLRYNTPTAPVPTIPFYPFCVPACPFCAITMPICCRVMRVLLPLLYFIWYGLVLTGKIAYIGSIRIGLYYYYDALVWALFACLQTLYRFFWNYTEWICGQTRLLPLSPPLLFILIGCGIAIGSGIVGCVC